MGCKTCSTGSGEKVAGCRSNGGCQTGGCNKMNVFDWLSNMDLPVVDKFDVVEVRFKGGRKEFFRNVHQLDLTTGDAIVVDVPNGHHLGHVSLQGELVRLQMQKRKIKNDDEIRSIYRIATSKDLEKFEEQQTKEVTVLYRTREIIREIGLEMKLSDVEYQADGTKATFFYSADDRVDFRQLIKVLASEFKLRVEMRQISLRQEAGRLGGIGSCGRELCCSTWLTDFKSVSTTAARYQNLSLNPSKLSGQCGRLKCCLNYELETYMDALEDIPSVNQPLRTAKGEAVLQKTDIFRKTMWFGYSTEDQWLPVPAKRVQEILEMNANNQVPANLLENTLPEPDEQSKSLNHDLEKLDKRFEKKSKNKRKKKKKSTGPKPTGQGPDQPQAVSQKPSGKKPSGKKNVRFNTRKKNDQ